MSLGNKENEISVNEKSKNDENFLSFQNSTKEWTESERRS